MKHKHQIQGPKTHNGKLRNYSESMKKRWRLWRIARGRSPNYVKPKKKTAKQQFKTFSDAAKHRWKDPEYRKNVTSNVKRYWSDPVAIAKMSKKVKASLKAFFRNNPNAYKIWSKTAKRNNRNPNLKRKKAASLREYWKNPDNRKRHAKAMALSWLNSYEARVTKQQQTLNEHFDEWRSNCSKGQIKKMRPCKICGRLCKHIICKGCGKRLYRAVRHSNFSNYPNLTLVPDEVAFMYVEPAQRQSTGTSTF
jgi:hypothetical protein